MAQPLFSLLGSDPEFLVAHAVRGSAVVVFVALLCVAPPLFVWAGVEAVSRASGNRLRRVCELTAVALLVALTLSPPLLRTISDGLWTPVVAGIVGVGMGWLYDRYAPIRGLFRTLSLAPIVFAVLFLGDGEVSRLWRGEEAAVAEAPEPERPVPVVLIVFDELPLSSLLDGDGRIDERAFPSFADLAAGSTWFPNTSAVSLRTRLAVPAILTGRYPEVEHSLPVHSDHPQNLFSLLATARVQNVVEIFTAMSAAVQRPLDIRTLAPDLGLVYLHIVSPEALRARLPSVSEGWRDFWRDDALPTEQGEAGSSDPIIEAFLAGIEPASPGDGPELSVHYLHTLVSHRPWRRLPTGTVVQHRPTFGFDRGGWGEPDWWSADGLRRHLLQLGFADRQLGLVLATLRERGLYDQSLLVVTADHGASFWPGPIRGVPDHAGRDDAIGVPLFVKRPGQKEGEVSTRFAESIDILPTITDILGVPLQEEVDGCSLFRPDCPRRALRWVIVGMGKKTGVPLIVEMPAAPIETAASVARKHRLFGEGYEHIHTPHAPPELRGATVSGMVRDAVAGTLTRVGRQPDGRPIARWVGRLALDEHRDGTRGDGQSADPIVVVAVDGIVRAAAPAPRLKQGRGVSLLLPEAHAPMRADALEFYVLEGEALAPLRVVAE